jgi:hypothetical protein
VVHRSDQRPQQRQGATTSRPQFAIDTGLKIAKTPSAEIVRAIREK